MAYHKTIIKGYIQPTHESVCSDVRKLQSMDVLKLQSTKADWNTFKMPFSHFSLSDGEFLKQRPRSPDNSS